MEFVVSYKMCFRAIRPQNQKFKKLLEKNNYFPQEGVVPLHGIFFLEPFPKEGYKLKLNYFHEIFHGRGGRGTHFLQNIKFDKKNKIPKNCSKWSETWKESIKEFFSWAPLSSWSRMRISQPHCMRINLTYEHNSLYL